MVIIRKKEALRQHLQEHRLQNTSIGFVPTMGALHRGHLALIEKALQQNEHTVCSIFVNPAQFNNPDDLAKYPKTPESDLAQLEAAGCHTVFLPEAEEMYPYAPFIKFNFGPLEEVMEGSFRPGHFSGVALVVSKLLNIVQPDRAYFGQKDLQQCRIVEKLVLDLSFPTKIQIEPTVREADGLALSSRNMRLSPQGRQLAPHLYKALQLAALELQKGTAVETAQNSALTYLQSYSEIKPEYLCIVQGGTLQPLQHVEQGDSVAICTAAYIEGVRLIDNILLPNFNN